MATITTRQLARDTAAVLSGLDGHPDGVIVTRDGEEIARLVPLSAIEREWRNELRSRGVDPDTPRGDRPRPTMLVIDKSARSLSDALAEARNAEPT
jgi:antitoxin (DNA-binding transcriptional repressor) of toxin-antitoxin stability system